LAGAVACVISSWPQKLNQLAFPARGLTGFARTAPARHYAGMIGLTDTQLGTVMDAARTLPPEKRDLYLQRIAAMLTMRGRGHFNNGDVTDVAALALAGLVHTDAA
jgi:hypothetical protein